MLCQAVSLIAVFNFSKYPLKVIPTDRTSLRSVLLGSRESTARAKIVLSVGPEMGDEELPLGRVFTDYGHLADVDIDMGPSQYS